MTGEVDYAVVKRDRHLLGDLTGVVRMDLSGLTFLDTSAIAVLLQCLAAAQRPPGSTTDPSGPSGPSGPVGAVVFQVVGAPVRLRSTLEVMGVAHLLTFTD